MIKYFAIFCSVCFLFSNEANSQQREINIVETASFVRHGLLLESLIEHVKFEALKFESFKKDDLSDQYYSFAENLEKLDPNRSDTTDLERKYQEILFFDEDLLKKNVERIVIVDDFFIGETVVSYISIYIETADKCQCIRSKNDNIEILPCSSSRINFYRDFIYPMRITLVPNYINHVSPGHFSFYYITKEEALACYFESMNAVEGVDFSPYFHREFESSWCRRYCLDCK